MKARGRRYLDHLRKAADAGLNAVAQEYAERVRARHIQGTRGARGRIYQRPGGRVHQASAPGDPPAQDTNSLYQGITYAKRANLRYAAGVNGVAKAYVLALEFGSAGRNLLPRPMWFPVLKEYASSDLVRVFIRNARAGL